jgi:hypothetical protein
MIDLQEIKQISFIKVLGNAVFTVVKSLKSSSTYIQSLKMTHWRWTNTLLTYKATQFCKITVLSSLILSHQTGHLQSF